MGTIGSTANEETDMDAADGSIIDHIEDLVAEEQRLRRLHETDPDQHERLAAVEVELDQCWDLLRQRRARTEFGADADGAHLRDPGIVEGYGQ